MALEELFVALDPAGHADDRARPTFNVLNQPVADGFVVLGEIELGNRLVVMSVGPERPVRMGDHDAHDGHGATRRPPSVRAVATGAGSVSSAVAAGAGVRLDLLRGLVLPQRFEGCLPQPPVGGEPLVLNLGDKLRAYPVHVARPAGRALAVEGVLIGLERFQLREEAIDFLSAEAGPDAAYMDEATVAVDAGDERPKGTVDCGVAADQHLVTRPAFGFGPAIHSP